MANKKEISSEFSAKSGNAKQHIQMHTFLNKTCIQSHADPICSPPVYLSHKELKAKAEGASR